jgi:hypothetical protein
MERAARVEARYPHRCVAGPSTPLHRALQALPGTPGPCLPGIRVCGEPEALDVQIHHEAEVQRLATGIAPTRHGNTSFSPRTTSITGCPSEHPKVMPAALRV